MLKLAQTIFLLLAMSSGAFAAEHYSESLSKLIAGLRKVVPAGWEVSVNRFHDTDDDDVHIEVWREGEVKFLEQTVINGPGLLLDEPVLPNPPRIFYFNFYLTDYLSPDDYARLREENAAIEAQLAKYTKALSDIKRHGKSRAFNDTRSLGYFPETEGEKKRVQEFIKYAESHPKHRITPNFYYEQMSFYFFDKRIMAPLESKKIDLECTTTLKAILRPFKPYVHNRVPRSD
jgi:hypothetical protein